MIALLVVIGSLAFNLWMYNGEKTEYTNYVNLVKSIEEENIEIDKYNKERYKFWENESQKVYNKAVYEFEQNRKPIIENEIEEIEQQLSKVRHTLELLYNLRINGVLCLHPNYQGLVPVSIIYGYFDTGRCTQFQGHEGAYNLYEDEKLKGMIINKLDVVSQQLGQLNESMVYVGQAIQECNERLSDLEFASNKMFNAINDMNSNVSRQINGVSNQMAAIEENTANSAYYSEVGARMTTLNTVYNILKD